MRHLAWLPIAVAIILPASGCGPGRNQNSITNRNDAIAAFQVGHVAEAKAMFERTLSWNLADPDALYYMGRISCVEDDWERAIYYFQCCIDVEPGFPTARRWLLYAEKSAGPIGDKLRFIPIPPQRK